MGSMPQTAMYPTARGNSVPKSPNEPANSLRLNSNEPIFISSLFAKLCQAALAQRSLYLHKLLDGSRKPDGSLFRLFG